MSRIPEGLVEPMLLKLVITRYHMNEIVKLTSRCRRRISKAEAKVSLTSDTARSIAAFSMATQHRSILSLVINATTWSETTCWINSQLDAVNTKL